MAYFKRDAKARMERILLRDSIEAEMSTEELVNHRTKISMETLKGTNIQTANALTVFSLLFWLVSSLVNFSAFAEITFLLLCITPAIIVLYVTGFKKIKKADLSKNNIKKRWENAIKKDIHPRVVRQYGYQFTTTFNRSELTANIRNQTEMDAINGASENSPVEISNYDDKTWFYYKGEMWITNEIYKTMDCVVALSYTGKGDSPSEERNITDAKYGSYSNYDELSEAIPKDTSETITLQVSEDLRYLIDLEDVKKKKKIENAKNIIEGTEDSNLEERSRRISQDVKDRVWNRDNGKCVECGSNENLEFDHIIPFSKGGANTYRNLQLLCEHCNRSKSDRIG